MPNEPLNWSALACAAPFDQQKSRPPFENGAAASIWFSLFADVRLIPYPHPITFHEPAQNKPASSPLSMPKPPGAPCPYSTGFAGFHPLLYSHPLRLKYQYGAMPEATIRARAQR